LNKHIIPITIVLLLLSTSFVGISYNVEKIEEPPATTGDGGLMDSAWPMHCRDTEHTAQSPYAPTGKYGIEKWRFGMEDMATQVSPAIDRNGTIYVAGGDYSFYAVYPNGTKKWQFESNGFYWATPALASDGTIYIGSTDNKLYAINPNGTLKWNLKVGDGWVYGSAAIDSDGIIYATSSFGQNICAIYPNGTKKWSYHTDGKVYSSPAVTDYDIESEYDIDTVYCGSNDGYLYALCSDNGSLKWRYKTGGYIQTAAAIGDDGTIYFGSWDGYFYSLYPNGTLRWRYLTRLIDDSSAAIAEDGTIYIGSVLPETGGNVYSFNPDGTENWVFETGGEIYSSPAVDNNEIVYIGSHDGFLYAINTNGTMRWKFDTGGYVDSSPAIDEDGIIYFVGYTPLGNSRLYAIEVREEAANLEIGNIIPRLFHFKVDITNTGNLEAVDIQWKILVDPFNFLWTDPNAQGTIETLIPEDSITLYAWPIFGLGLVHIKIMVSAPEANPDRKDQYATIFGPFIKLRE